MSHSNMCIRNLYDQFQFLSVSDKIRRPEKVLQSVLEPHIKKYLCRGCVYPSFPPKLWEVLKWICFYFYSTICTLKASLSNFGKPEIKDWNLLATLNGNRYHMYRDLFNTNNVLNSIITYTKRSATYTCNKCTSLKETTTTTYITTTTRSQK